MVQVWADHAFECGMDLSEEPPYPVTRRSDLPEDVIIKPAQHRELSNGFVSDLDGSQRVGQSSGGLRNDCGVSGIGFCFAGVEVCDATHR